MLPEIIAHANILDTFGGEVKDRIFHPSGWSAPNDSDSGLSFGEVVEVGGGYMRMDVQDERTTNQYTLRPGYIEVGVGVGETIKGKAVTTAAGKQLVKWVSDPSARDFVKNSRKIIEVINKYLKKPQSDLHAGRQHHAVRDGSVHDPGLSGRCRPDGLTTRRMD